MEDVPFTYRLGTNAGWLAVNEAIRHQDKLLGDRIHALAIHLDQKGCDGHEGKESCHEMANLRRWQGRKEGIGGDPRLRDHITFLRKHGAVLSPTYT
jgi:hypothetical protein